MGYSNIRLLILKGCRLFLQFREECLLPVSHIGFIAFGIDVWVRAAGVQFTVLFLQPVIAAVSAKKNIAGKRLEDSKPARVITGDFWIRSVVHQLVSGIDVRTAYNH